MKFTVGQHIHKPKGYRFDGIVVAVFTTLSGEPRVVAEIAQGNGAGMLHIFNEQQLELTPTPNTP